MGTNVQPLAAGLGAAGRNTVGSASAGFKAGQQLAIQQFAQDFGVTDSTGFGRQLQGVLTAAAAARNGNFSGVREAIHHLVGFLAGQGAQAKAAPAANNGGGHCRHNEPVPSTQQVGNKTAPAPGASAASNNSQAGRSESSAKPGHRHGHHHHAHGHKGHGQPRPGASNQPAPPAGSPAQPVGLPQQGHEQMVAKLSELLQSLFPSQGNNFPLHKLKGFVQEAMKNDQPSPQHAAQGQAADLSHAAPMVRAA